MGNFLNDVIQSAFKVIELETGDILTLQCNENGGIFLHTPDRYLSISETNQHKFIPLIVYVNKPEVKALLSVINLMKDME